MSRGRRWTRRAGRISVGLAAAGATRAAYRSLRRRPPAETGAWLRVSDAGRGVELFGGLAVAGGAAAAIGGAGGVSVRARLAATGAALVAGLCGAYGDHRAAADSSGDHDGHGSGGLGTYSGGGTDGRGNYGGQRSGVSGAHGGGFGGFPGFGTSGGSRWGSRKGGRRGAVFLRPPGGPYASFVTGYAPPFGQGGYGRRRSRAYAARGGSGSPAGLRAQLTALGEGRLTSGGVKLLGIGAAGLVAGTVLKASPLDQVLTAVVIAGAAHGVSLLDGSPGRAAKAVIAAGAPGLLRHGPGAVLAAAPVGAAAAALRDGLTERTRLGQAGAHALGAALGAAIAVANGRPGLLLHATGVVALTAAGDRIATRGKLWNAPVFRQVGPTGLSAHPFG
ncbi:hypothetical protein [Actinacidiphila acididurans]|uniref:Uncharacterized protein n=1 Tax=Actinacidiphila acididurans TaxID=2784346 RepID=A0ABS2TRV1_9ACTN|nr:hypothetical protein [Actinacidiphila acididurans]MBM9506064.1 hypothetical protein [Actinacidiphila acididurans]